jgi:hypothetical protein
MEYYTYAYLRENRTPYYIGKGKRNRVYHKGERCIKPPKDKSRIIFLKQNLTEEEAFKHEIYMIAVFGRKDLGTGILHNKTNGGEGISGYVFSDEIKAHWSQIRKGKIASEETKIKMSEVQKGNKNGFYNKNHSQESRSKMSTLKMGDKNHNYGKPKTEEIKKKMSISSQKFHFTIIKDCGKVYETNNLTSFCKEHSLHRSCLQKTYTGKPKYHKGFKIIEKNDLRLFKNQT